MSKQHTSGPWVDLLEAAQFFLSYEEATHEEREWIIRSAISHFKAAIAKIEEV